jgi:hypothetical protein
VSALLPLLHRLRRALRRAGWAGALGLALLLLAMLLDVGGSAALESRREALAAERARLQQAGRAVGGAAAATGGRAAPLVMAFPAAAELPQLLTRLHAMGEEWGLALSRSEYRSAPEPGTALTRVSLQLPVRGEFGAIYSWLDEVLAAMPAVGLEALSVRRGDSELVPLEAELRLVIYVRQR